MKKVSKEIKKFLNSPAAAGSDIKTSGETEWSWLVGINVVVFLFVVFFMLACLLFHWPAAGLTFFLDEESKQRNQEVFKLVAGWWVKEDFHFAKVY